MKRILVIGNAGSGKTTFSQALSRKLCLPLIHLDQVFWMPHWKQREQAEFDQLLINELKKEAWIIDGNYTRTLPLRIEYADTVIFLDLNRWICTWRVIKLRLLFRALKSYNLASPIYRNYLMTNDQ